MQQFLVQITSILVVLHGREVSPWNYATQGTWAQQYPDCGLAAQSPIEIDTQRATPKDVPPLKFSNYDAELDAVITNNCHTAEITLRSTPNRIPAISGGPFNLSDSYNFYNAHFHWNAEHVIDFKRYTMELHIVHINTKYSPKDAGNYKDGFIVVTIFYRQGPIYYFQGLQNVNRALRIIQKCRTSAPLSGLVLEQLVGGVTLLTKQKPYTYKGSFTSPPCSEAVDFVIYAQAIRIGIFQYVRFPQLLDDTGSKIKMNFRDLQAQGERSIYVWP